MAKKLENMTDNVIEDKVKIISFPSLQNPFLVFFKPKGIPTVSIGTIETIGTTQTIQPMGKKQAEKNSAFSQVLKLFPEIAKVKGKKENEYGLLQRLDTITSGLVLVATTQESFDDLFIQQKQSKMKKNYIAVCHKSNSLQEGFPKRSDFAFPLQKQQIIESKFRSFGKGINKKSSPLVRPVSLQDTKSYSAKKATGPIYQTMIEDFWREEGKNKGKMKVLCSIQKGFRHQIRVHLAWRGFPIFGDPLYDDLCSEQNSECQAKDFFLQAVSLEFFHPTTKQKVHIHI